MPFQLSDGRNAHFFECLQSASVLHDFSMALTSVRDLLPDYINSLSDLYWSENKILLNTYFNISDVICTNNSVLLLYLNVVLLRVEDPIYNSLRKCRTVSIFIHMYKFLLIDEYPHFILIPNFVMWLVYIWQFVLVKRSILFYLSYLFLIENKVSSIDNWQWQYIDFFNYDFIILTFCSQLTLILLWPQLTCAIW